MLLQTQAISKHVNSTHANLLELALGASVVTAPAAAHFAATNGHTPETQ